MALSRIPSASLPASPATDLSNQRATGLVAALIPAYNEARFIGSVVLAVRRHVDLVVVVDDGSSDETTAIAQQAGAVVVQHSRNQGKAAAMNTGFGYLRSIAPAAVVMLDGDGQHYAEDIPAVLGPIRSGAADMVVGSRFLGIANDIPGYRQVGQHSLTLATNLASGVRISDSQSGFRALSERALQAFRFSQAGFSIESEMQFLAQEYGLRVAEVPIQVNYAEPAKRNPVMHGIQVVNGILRMVGQTRPLFYFSAAGMVLLTPGVSLGLYIVDIYARTQQLAVGYALITVLACVIGMLLFFSGVILHSTRCMLLDMRQSLLTRIANSDETYLPKPSPNLRRVAHVEEHSEMTLLRHAHVQMSWAGEQSAEGLR